MYMLVRVSYNPGIASIYSRMQRPGKVFWDSNNKFHILEKVTRGTFVTCISTNN